MDTHHGFFFATSQWKKIKEGHFLLSFLPPIFFSFSLISRTMTKKDLFNQEVIYKIMFDMTSEIIIWL